MQRFSALFVFTVLAALFGASLQASTLSPEFQRIARTCKPYETFTGGCESPCQPHCPKYDDEGVLREQAPFCVHRCDYKCVCKEGLVADPEQGGECVSKDKCLPPPAFKKASAK